MTNCFKNNDIFINGQPITDLVNRLVGSRAFSSRVIDSVVNSVNDLCVACDHSGNVYVAFRSNGETTPPIIKDTLGNELGILPIGSSYVSSYVVKFDSSGRYLYTRIIESVTNLSITCDSSDNLYLVGRYSSSTTIGITANILNQDSLILGSLPLIPDSGSTAALIKFDKTGNYMYSRVLDGVLTDRSSSVACDSLGNVYHAGYYNAFSPTFIKETSNDGEIVRTLGSLPISEVVPNFGESPLSAFVLKFDKMGKYLYARTIDCIGDESELYSVAIDPNDNVYLTGEYKNGNEFIKIKIKGVVSDITTVSTLGTLPTSEGTTRAAFLIKFDRSGRYMYARILDSTNFQKGTSVACDSLGNVYFAGKYSNTGATISAPRIKGVSNGSSNVQILGTLVPISFGERSAFMIKFDSSGKYVYSRILKSDSLADCNNIACDSSGNVYFVGTMGSSGNTILGITNGNTSVSTLGIIVSNPYESSAFMIKFDKLGRYVYARTIQNSVPGSGTGTSGNGVACDYLNNAFFCGDYSGEATITDQDGKILRILPLSTRSKATFLIRFDSIEGESTPVTPPGLLCSPACESTIKAFTDAGYNGYIHQFDECLDCVNRPYGRNPPPAL